MAKRKTVNRSAAADPRWTSDIAPAPGELKIVQAFVNTAGRRKHAEELASPRALASWLAQWRLAPEDLELRSAHLELAKALRDGFRALLRHNNGAALDKPAAARFEAAAAETPLRLRVGTDGGPYLTAMGEGAGALGRLLGIFAEARFGVSWPRFKACPDADCGAAFYDATKNLAGKWCSARCNNRNAARRSRRRRRLT